MDHADEIPGTNNPIMMIGVTAKCTLCETVERCDDAGEAKRGRESTNTHEI